MGLGSVLFLILPAAVLAALNSRSAMLAVVGIGCVALPWAIARLHRLPPLFPAAGFYAIVAVGWWMRPAEPDGDPKPLAGYLPPWRAPAVLWLAAVGAVLSKRR